MLKRNRTRSFGYLMVAAALFVAACGSTADSGEPTIVDPNGGETSDGLPVSDVDNEGDDPGTADACLVDEPECNDTPPVDADVTDLPLTPDDEPDATKPDDPTLSGVTVDGGLTISEALSTEAEGTLAVNGHLIADGDGIRLCEGLVGLGERYGCDGAAIDVINLNLEAASGFLIFHEGISYTETPITLFGELVDGSLVLRESVTG